MFAMTKGRLVGQSTSNHTQQEWVLTWEGQD